MKSIRTIPVAFLTLTIAVAGNGQEPAANVPMDKQVRADPWQVQAGWVHQWGRSMSVSGPAPSLPNGAFPVRSLGGRRLSTRVPGFAYPDNSALIPRTFDDGYVRPDYWTGDSGLLAGPNPERYGTTWNWGADHASQYDYDGGNHPTLTFHADGHAYLGGATSLTGSNAQDDDLPTDGIELKATRQLHTWLRGGNAEAPAPTDVILNMDLTLSLAWFPSKEQSYQRSASRGVFASSETYTYFDYYGASDAAGGPWPPLAVPYAGLRFSHGGRSVDSRNAGVRHARLPVHGNTPRHRGDPERAVASARRGGP